MVIAAWLWLPWINLQTHSACRLQLQQGQVRKFSQTNTWMKIHIIVAYWAAYVKAKKDPVVKRLGFWRVWLLLFSIFWNCYNTKTFPSNPITLILILTKDFSFTSFLLHNWSKKQQNILGWLFFQVSRWVNVN